MNRLALVVALSFSLAGCVGLTEATYSSASYLSLARSGADLNHPAADSARELARLLEVRGFALVDNGTAGANGQLVLKFAKGNRALAAQKDDSQPLYASDVGSVVYAWVTPIDASSASINLVAKPTLAGQEPCTKDGLPCQEVDVNDWFLATYMSGRTEAETIHGLLGELALEGYVKGSLPSPELAPDPACIAQRRSILIDASKLTEADARAKLIATAPACAPQ